MRTRRTVVAVSVAVVAALSVPVLASADGHGGSRTDHRGHQALTAIGLTADQRVVAFDVDRPSGSSAIGKVSGLRGDTKVVGIDFRVQNGKLYGVGDKGGVYTLDTSDGRAGRSPSSPSPSPVGSSASTSTPPPTGCASSATPGRTCGTTSTTAPLPGHHRRRHPHQPHHAALHRHGRDRSRVHQQRPRRRHRDDPVRHRHPRRPRLLQSPANVYTSPRPGTSA